MRHISLLVAVFTVNLFAFTNLTFTPDTITFGGKTVVSGNFSAPGDSADIVIFIDDNANSILDQGEITVYNSLEEGKPFVDGGGEMGDTVADGLTSIELSSGNEEGSPFSFPGTYVMIMSDNGGPDTAQLVVKPGATTNTSIAGTVSGPSGALANVLVFVGIELPDDKFHAIARSGANGGFLVYLPDTMQGKECFIGAEDAFDVLVGQALIPPEPVETTVVASITGLNFVFEKATQFIAGVVVNELGAAVGDVELYFEDRENDIGFGVDVDANGAFIAPVKPAKWEIHFDDWETEEKYMTPQMKVEVTANDDTVEIIYVVYTTNATITGTVIDSAGINLEEDFSVNVSVDTTGIWLWEEGVWYHSQADISEDGNFSIPVNSKFVRYWLNTWADDLPQGYYVSPSNIDSVGPGQTGIVIKIKEANQFVALTVIDETNTPAANVDIELWKEASDIDAVGQTDMNGIAIIPVFPGNWEVWVEESNYMNQEHFTVTVEESDDTVKATYMVYTTDEDIGGTVSGDISEIYDKLYIIASVHIDSLGITFVGEGEVDASGAFNIPVSVDFPGYTVMADIWDIPEGYIIVPQYFDENYLYKNVAPGTDNVAFEVLTAQGSISGKFLMSVPNIPDVEVGIIAVDSVQMVGVKAHFQNDTTYKIELPNGVYTVAGGWAAPDTFKVFTVDSIVINNNDVVINFTDGGIVPVVFTPVKNKIAFNLRSYPNPFRGATNIAFSTPVNGKATLKIYDLNGRTLKTLYSGNVTKGNYYFSLNTNTLGCQLKSGYLIARLSINGDKRYTKNIQLIHLK